MAPPIYDRGMAHEANTEIPPAPSGDGTVVAAALTERDVDCAWIDGEGLAQVDFEAGLALAALLRSEVVSVNARWWREDLSEKDRASTCVFVDCSDVFAWACGDAEELPYAEIENVYRMWRKDPKWGPAVWCCIRRNEMPQPPVLAAIAGEGLWDLAAMPLGPNVTDEKVAAFFALVAARSRGADAAGAPVTPTPSEVPGP